MGKGERILFLDGNIGSQVVALPAGGKAILPTRPHPLDENARRVLVFHVPVDLRQGGNVIGRIVCKLRLPLRPPGKAAGGTGIVERDNVIDVGGRGHVADIPRVGSSAVGTALATEAPVFPFAFRSIPN